MKWPKIKLFEVKIDFNSLGKRVGLGATVAAGVIATQLKTTGQLPTSLSALAPAIGLGVLAMFPAGPEPTGVKSLIPAAVNSAVAVVTAPAAQRQQEADAQKAALLAAAANAGAEAALSALAAKEKTALNLVTDLAQKADAPAPTPNDAKA